MGSIKVGLGLSETILVLVMSCYHLGITLGQQGLPLGLGQHYILLEEQHALLGEQYTLFLLERVLLGLLGGGGNLDPQLALLDPEGFLLSLQDREIWESHGEGHLGHQISDLQWDILNNLGVRWHLVGKWC